MRRILLIALALGGTARAQGVVAQRLAGHDTGAWARTGEFRYYPELGAVDHSGLALSGRYVVFGDYLDGALGTEAGAAWVFTLPGPLTPSEPAPEDAGAPGISVAPNPVARTATVTLRLAVAGPVRVALYDVLGRGIALLNDGPLAAGAHALTVDTTILPMGVFVVRVTGPGFAVSRTMTVAR